MMRKPGILVNGLGCHCHPTLDKEVQSMCRSLFVGKGALHDEPKEWLGEDSGLQQEALMSFVSCRQQTLTCLEHQAGPKQRQNLGSFDLCSTINYFAHTFCENGTDLAPTHPIWWDSAFNHRHK